MVYIEIPKEFDKQIIDIVAKKLELAPSYVEWLLSVGNKEALKEYNTAQQNAHLTPEILATSQAVSNASAVSQSDSDTPPAQAQVA